MALIDNWGRTLLRSYTVWLALAGLLTPHLPAILELIAGNISLLSWMDQPTKDTIRFACLLAIPFARVIQQKSLTTGTTTKEDEHG